MGQSLSNLCGLKPAEPKQWPQFEAKMKSEVRPCRAATSWLHPHLATHPYLSTPSPQGLSDAAIAAFKHNFVTLASGANLMISEAAPPVKLGDQAAACQPPERLMPLSVSARLWPPRLSVLAQQCVCRVHAGSPRLGPPRPGAALFASGSVRAYCSLTLRGGAAETARADCLPAAYLLTAY